MTFYSTVSPATFTAIRERRRIIEPRLNDGAHRKIKPGDLVVLTNRDTKEELVAKVVGVLRYPSFVELFHANQPERFGVDDIRELLTEVHHYYTTDNEIKFGVLGLKLHILKRGEQ
jgi:ASC-1-like (ASCH) protein